MNYDLNSLVMNPSLFKEYLNSFKTIVVIGQTGCGKSTVVPSWIAKLKPHTKLLLTQPRRLATENIAERICALNGYTMTHEVGFFMGRRFFDAPTNAISLATVGSAVSVLMAKPDYYDTIILDEVHESSAQMEQLISIASNIQAAYGAQVILMSATTDLETIQKRFSGQIGVFNMEEHCQQYKIHNNNLVIDFSGEIIYDSKAQPQDVATEEEDFVKQEPMRGYDKFRVQRLTQEEFEDLRDGKALSKAVDKIIHNMAIQVARILDDQVNHIFDPKGDILCFTPGIKEFLALKKQILSIVNPKYEGTYEIRFIHSRFSEEFKQRAIKNDSNEENTPKINILISTTICETSITIPTLRYVVDSCLCKHMIDEKLKTILCSTRAIYQRMGRLGRVQEGLYIPCINPELLEELPDDYAKADIYENINMFIVNCYSQQSNDQLDMRKLLFQENSIFKLKEVENRIEKLKNDGFLTSINNETRITPKGYIVSSLKGEFSDATFDYYMSFLQAPAIQTLIGAVGKQTALQIFVHEIEQVQYASEYRSIQYQQQMKSDKGKKQKNIEIVDFSNYKTVAYAALVSKPQHFNAPEGQKSKLPIYFPFNNSYFYELMGKNYGSLQNYNHRYAMARIVALWRQYFPIPTKDPTEEEIVWCKMRLLSPSALREVELEAMQYYTKLEGAFNTLYNFEPIHQVDNDLLAMKYVCTAQDIEDAMEEANYNYNKVTYNEHNIMWESLSQKYIHGIYKPFVCRFLDDEKMYEQNYLIQIITCLSIANNDFMGFIYSHKLDNIYKMISQSRYEPYKNAKFGYESFSNKMQVICNGHGKELSNETVNKVKQQFTDLVSQKKMHCDVKLNISRRGGKIHCQIQSTQKQISDIVQFICRAATLKGGNYTTVMQSQGIIKDMFMKMIQVKYMKQFQYCMKLPHATLPTLQAYSFLNSQNKAGDALDIQPEMPFFDNSNDKSDDYSYYNYSYDQSYSEQNDSDDIQVNKYVTGVRNVPGSRMGLLIPFNESGGELQNYVNFQDFSVYTGTFFMGNIRSFSGCKTGILVSLTSYFLFQHIYAEINKSRQLQFVQIMNSNKKPLFAARFRLHNPGLTILFQLMAAFSQISEHLSNQMNVIQQKIDILQGPCKNDESISKGSSKDQLIFPFGSLLQHIQHQYQQTKIAKQIKESLNIKKGQQGSIIPILTDLFKRQEFVFAQAHDSIVYGFLGYDVEENVDDMMHFHTFEYNVNK